MLWLNASFLWLLLLALPLIFFLIVLLGKKHQALKSLQGEGASRSKVIFRPAILYSLSFVFLVLALARPALKSFQGEDKKQGIDAILVLDTSLSMYAQDVSPNRMHMARRFLEEIVLNFTSDRLGLVFFAGDAFVQSPLTSDYNALLMYLEIVEPGIIPVGGSATKLALQKAAERLLVDAAENEEYGKAIILVTDGDDTMDDPTKYAEEIAAKGISVFVVGVGTPAGQRVPDYTPDGKITDYKKTADGEYYVSKLNQELMKKIAHAGKGAYFNLDDRQEVITPLLKEIRQLKQKVFSTSKKNAGFDLYPFLVFLAFVMLAIEYYLGYGLKLASLRNYFQKSFG